MTSSREVMMSSLRSECQLYVSYCLIWTMTTVQKHWLIYKVFLWQRLWSHASARCTWACFHTHCHHSYYYVAQKMAFFALIHEHNTQPENNMYLPVLTICGCRCIERDKMVEIVGKEAWLDWETEAVRDTLEELRDPKLLRQAEKQNKKTNRHKENPCCTGSI